jgi:hypothetical protein
MYDSLKFMQENLDDADRTKFSQDEINKFSRVVKYMETTVYSDNKLIEGRTDFYNWFTEYDRRRGTNFLKTFPQLSTFMEQCYELART